MMERLTVLITDALTVIGSAAAIAFAEKGANVAVAGLNAEQGETLQKKLRSYKNESEFVLADSRCDEDVRNMVDWTTSRFGSLDVAVNCSGTKGKPGHLIEQTAETFKDVFETNVLGTLLSMKYELRRMLRQNFGVIINLSSIYGQRGEIGAGVYSASQHAVEGLTKTAALEAAGTNVRVLAVAPSPIDSGAAQDGSQFIKGAPHQRMEKPEEVAQIIVFLASAEAALSSGQIIRISGGKIVS